LPVREMNTPVYDPQKAGNSLTKNPWRPEPNKRKQPDQGVQYRLFQKRSAYAGKS